MKTFWKWLYILLCWFRPVSPMALPWWIYVPVLVVAAAVAVFWFWWVWFLVAAYLVLSILLFFMAGPQ